MQYTRKNADVAIVTSGKGSRKSVKWEAGVRRQMQCQPRLMSRTNECAKAALVSAQFTLRGKATAAHMHFVVNADSEVRTRLGEIGVLSSTPRELLDVVVHGRAR